MDLLSILISIALAACSLLCGGLLGKRIVHKTGFAVGTGVFIIALILAFCGIQAAQGLGLRYGVGVEFAADCLVLFLFGIVAGLNTRPSSQSNGS